MERFLEECSKMQQAGHQPARQCLIWVVSIERIKGALQFNTKVAGIGAAFLYTLNFHPVH